MRYVIQQQHQKNVSDDLLLEILTILTDKAGTTVYETWVAKEKASYLFKLGYELGITELPPIDWRKAYSERWDYSRTIETLKLAIPQPQTEDFMTVDQQELELATTVDLDREDDEVSDRVLELLAHIESLGLGVIDILELINRLTAIAIEKRNVELAEQEEEPDTDDDEEYEDEEDEDQE